MEAYKVVENHPVKD